MAEQPPAVEAQLTFLDKDGDPLFESELQRYTVLPRVGEFLEYDGVMRVVVAVRHIPHTPELALVPMLFCRKATAEEQTLFALDN